MLEEILQYNKEFVESKAYEKYAASKYPNKKLAILSCMDTRLTELLPAALGLKNGDAKIIKNAGGIIADPFGSVMRSLLIAVHTLGVEHILVIGHTDCGVQGLSLIHIFEVGAILEGKITGITKFGAFVELGEGKTGMVHISEVAPTFVKEITDFVSEGQTVKVKVLSVGEDGKISLSMKKAMETAPVSYTHLDVYKRQGYDRR